MGRLSRLMLVVALLCAAGLGPAAGQAFAGDGGVCFACEPKPDPDPPDQERPGPDGAGAQGDEVLSLGELRRLSRSVGFVNPKLAAAVAMAESSGRVRAVNRNRKPKSVDRGLFQINSYWHPEVSRSCAFRARCNARAALRISDGGRDWRQWAAWSNQSYEDFMREARSILLG